MFHIPKKKKQRAIPPSKVLSPVAAPRAKPVPVVAIKAKTPKAVAVHTSSLGQHSKNVSPVSAHKFQIPKKKKKRTMPSSQVPSPVAAPRAKPVPVVATRVKIPKATTVHTSSSLSHHSKKASLTYTHKKAVYSATLNRKRPRSIDSPSVRPRHASSNKARVSGKHRISGIGTGGRLAPKSSLIKKKHAIAKAHHVLKAGSSRPKLHKRKLYKQEKRGQQIVSSKPQAKVRKVADGLARKSPAVQKKKQSKLAWSKSSSAHVTSPKSSRAKTTQRKPTEATKGKKVAKSKQQSDPKIHPKKRKQKLLRVNKQTDADAQAALEAAKKAREQRRREKQERKAAKKAAKKAKKKAERKEAERLEKLREKLTKFCRVCDKKTFMFSVLYDDERLFSADLVEGVSAVDDTVTATDLIQCQGCQMRVHCRCYLDSPITVPIKEWLCRLCSYQNKSPHDDKPALANASVPPSVTDQVPDASGSVEVATADSETTVLPAAVSPAIVPPAAAIAPLGTYTGTSNTLDGSSVYSATGFNPTVDTESEAASSGTNLETSHTSKNESQAVPTNSAATIPCADIAPVEKMIDSRTGLPICLKIEWPSLAPNPDTLNHQGYGSLISFLCKFNECKDLNLASCTHAAVEQGLLYPNNSDFLVKLHISLLSGIGIIATTENWCDKLLEVVSSERQTLGLAIVPDMVRLLEDRNYPALSLEDRLSILNCLCNMQLYQNKDFTTALRAKNKSGSLDFNCHVLRDVPMGVDRRKTRYWLFEDAHSEVRLFTERVGEGYTTASWELIINTHDGLRKFVETLSRSNLTCELLLWRNLRRRIKVIEKMALKKAQARKREERRIQAQQRQELLRIAWQSEGRSQRRCRKTIDYSSSAYDKQFLGLD